MGCYHLTGDSFIMKSLIKPWIISLLCLALPLSIVSAEETCSTPTITTCMCDCRIESTVPNPTGSGFCSLMTGPMLGGSIHPPASLCSQSNGLPCTATGVEALCDDGSSLKIGNVDGKLRCSLWTRQCPDITKPSYPVPVGIE